MSKQIDAVFGNIEPVLIHQINDGDIKMIESLINDVYTFQNESKNSYLFGWATAFLGASISAFLALLTFPPDSSRFILACSLTFITFSLGIYFLINWNMARKKEASEIKRKKAELDALLKKIKSRIPRDIPSTHEYETLILSEQTLQKNI